MVKSEAIGALTPIFSGDFKALTLLNHVSHQFVYQKILIYFFHPGDSFVWIVTTWLEIHQINLLQCMFQIKPEWLKSGEHRIPITHVTANLRLGCGYEISVDDGQKSADFLRKSVHQLTVEEKSSTSSKYTAVVFLYARPKLNFNDYDSWLRDGSFCEPKIANQSGFHVKSFTGTKFDSRCICSRRLF